MRPVPIVEQDGILLLTLDDPTALNEGQAVGLRQTLYQWVTSKQPQRLAIDLSAIDYISSSGIALLIGIKRRVDAGNGRVVLHSLHPDVLDLFNTMNLSRLFEITPSQSQAVELLSSSPSQ